MRSVGLLGLALVAAWAFPVAAFAEMPDYDVKPHCNRVASVGGGMSQMILQGCYQEEQSAYDQLKPMWDKLLPQLREHCDQIAKVGGGGSFTILQGCVQEELQARKQNQQFQFRR